ncbi:MAG: HAD family hydrolase [Ancrocorticia sp.]|uniref:HAD family hydrolase n=1 Tax=Ancrocorticia sp. TaxID=2593684 RepID=UPI003F914931
MLATPTDPREYSHLEGIKLVASDMDNTLVGSSGELPDAIWETIRALRERGILFVPASGRQVTTLAEMFEPVAAGMPLISANGGLLARDGQILYSVRVHPDIVREVVHIIRDLAHQGVDLGILLIGEKASYTERTDQRFVTEVQRYFHQLEVLEDILDAEDEIVKLAIYSFDGLDQVMPRIQHYDGTHSLIFSADDWVDIQGQNVDKGVALEELQKILGISRDETVVFGDYLNDTELMHAGTHSFAVANAHPDIIKAARYVAPSCEDQGVISVLQQIVAAR